MTRWIFSALVLAAGPLMAQESDWRLELPVPYQVIQRTGYVAAEAHEHAEGGPRLGFADVMIRGTVPANAEGDPEYQLPPSRTAEDGPWTKLVHQKEEDRFVATVRVPAGWHRLVVRWGTARATVEPFGVGEVFLVAGQSYAAGANDELLKVADSAGRVTAYDIATNTWRIAHDPQPGVGDGGTLWPALGDLLVPVLRVPVGFVNVASGGTSSRQWLPGTPLYQRMEQAGLSIGSFRAVLWQQGESDVIEKVATAVYQSNLRTIRDSLAKSWQRDAVWLLAKSTLHPTVYNDPAGEARIRTAIEQLWRRPGFAPGPDTDILAGENRGGPGTRRHFTGAGQRRAALLWYTAIWNEIHRAPQGAWGKPKLMTFEGDRRCLVWGDKPARPAPALLLFATALEDMARLPVYSEVGRYLSADGFLVVAIEPPCHGVDVRPGERPALQGWPDRCQGEDQLIAPFVRKTQDVLQKLIDDGYVDPERIAVAGTSRGGFIAFQFAAADPRIKAAAGFAPVTNLLALREFAGQEENPVVKQLSLVNTADRLANRAVWFSIGNHDLRVNTDDAIAFARRVAEAGAKANSEPRVPLPVEFFVGASVGHATPARAHEQAADFIRRHVLR